MFAAAALGLVAAGPALCSRYFWAMRIDLPDSAPVHGGGDVLGP
jgi:hypothetical protein